MSATSDPDPDFLTAADADPILHSPLSTRPRNSGDRVDAAELVFLLDQYAQQENLRDNQTTTDLDHAADSGATSNTESCSSSSYRASRLQRKVPSTSQQLDKFLMLLAMSLQEYGCPTAVLETLMNDVAEGLGRPAKFSFFNGYAFASWGPTEAGHRGPQTQLFGDWSNLNVYKLQLCDELARHVASYSKPEASTAAPSRRMSVSSKHRVLSTRFGKTWLRTVARYLGGTLYGVKLNMSQETRLGETPSNVQKDVEAEPVSVQTQLTEQILHVASVGPAVATQIKSAVTLKSDYADQLDTSPSVLDESTETLPRPKVSKQHHDEIEIEEAVISNISEEDVPAALSHTPYKRRQSKKGLKSVRTRRTRSTAAPSNLRRTQTQHIKLFMSIAASDALQRIIQIREAPSPYPSWLSILIYGFSSGGCCAIFFGGGWWDVLASFVMGSFVGGLAKLSAYNEGFERIFEFCSAFFVGFFCRLLVVWKIPICPFATTISSIIQIVQGTNITLSIMELASRHPGAGISRLAYSLTVTALIGIGLQFGAALASRISNNQSVDLISYSACPNALSTETQWALFLPTILAFLVDLNAHPRQYFFMTLISTAAQVVYVYAYPALSDPLASFIAAFAMGALSHVYSHFTMSNPIVGVLAGLQVLVPGTLAVRAFSSASVTNGVELAVSVLVIALSLGLGLFLGSVVVGRAGGFRRGVVGRLGDRNHVLAI
ncbi:hypothetical protein HDU77_001435 [Chytriomyces hyalinus]|nr:hypothetical protein HDU77_001435 [Chytriomyces hyalinus]